MQHFMKCRQQFKLVQPTMSSLSAPVFFHFRYVEGIFITYIANDHTIRMASKVRSMKHASSSYRPTSIDIILFEARKQA